MRTILLPAMGLLTLTACDGDTVRISSTTTRDEGERGVLRVVQSLQCPQTLGSLTRKGSATREGLVCNYSGPRGADVSLHLVDLDGGAPDQALAAFETRLAAALPQARDGLRAQPATENATAASEGATDTASVRAPGVDIQAKGDDASVRLPGMRIETKGDSASVRIGGLHIDANDSSGAVAVNTGSGDRDNVSIQARDDAAEVRTRASGDATRTSWILTDNRPSPEGWRLVGYEARGPAGGPIVVATVRSRDRDQDAAFDDAKALVTLNVGK